MEEQTASTLRLAVVNRATEPTESEIRNILEDQVFKEGHLTYYNYVKLHELLTSKKINIQENLPKFVEVTDPYANIPAGKFSKLSTLKKVWICCIKQLKEFIMTLNLAFLQIFKQLIFQLKI